MKKLQKLLLLAFFSIGIYGTTYAQVPTVDDTQTGVVAGGKYTYTVPNPAGQTWVWTVINSAGTIIDGTGGEFTLTDVQDYQKEITWTANGTFYVLVETTTTSTSCTNQYAIQVDVATNDYAVIFDAGTVNVYCADDANIASGMEITLDVTLAGGAPAATYYDMEVQFKIDGGAIQTATIGTGNKFNIPGIVIADPVTPGFANVTVTIVQVKDKNGVIFNPLAINEDYVITINPIPAKPTISF
tara:strand:- start:9376 stop:10104 length:729 start_codon:yes stop_codon:yes gene_type:complete